MIIEWLKFRVSPQHREQFIQQDARIWTPALSQHPGFRSKQVWISPYDLQEVVLVIQWTSREQWQAFPRDRLQQLETELQQATAGNPKITEAREYQIRKFSPPPRP